MAINYSSVTYITDGQAITATNLNAPSVDLATRSVEVQRNSLYEDFLENYSNSVKVRLTPLISSSQDSSNIEIFSNLKQESSNNYISYTFALTDAVISVYSDKFPGSRYLVQGSEIASHFSNSNPGATTLHSPGLFVPGDGIYLKRPTKYITSVSDTGSFAEDVLPSTEAASTGRTYVETDQALTNSIVKLPLRNKVSFTSSGHSDVSAFLTALAGAQWGGSTITNLAASVDGQNSITIAAGSDTYTLYVTGLHNTLSQVSKVYMEGGSLVLEVTESTSPIYHQTAATACTTIGLQLYDETNFMYIANTTVIPQNSAQFSIGTVDLDNGYMYIQLARLTETSLIVGHREFSLLRNYISNNSAYSSTSELNNIHGAPIEDYDTNGVDASKSYKVDLRSELPIPKGKVTLGKRSTIVADKLRCDFSRDPQLLRLLEFNRGSTLNLLEIRVTVLTQVTTASSPASFRVGNYVKAKNNSNTVVNNLFFGDTNSVSYVTIPSDSLTTALNEISVTSVLGTAFNVLSSALVTSKTDCVIEISETGGIVIDTGEVYVELDLLI